MRTRPVRSARVTAGAFPSLLAASLLLGGEDGRALAAERFCVAPPPPARVEAPGSGPAAGESAESLATAPRVEWRLHKSADGSHPDGREQQLLWLMNRARAAPAQEGVRLATTPLPDVAVARKYFGVDVGLLAREFAGYAPRAPAAFDARLHAAALAHARDLVARGAQDHRGQLQRVTASGFRWSAFRGNVLSRAPSPETAHAAFAIDWGRDVPDDGDGMQAGRQHRLALMSQDGAYTNVGIAVLADDAARSGPLVVTGNFCTARAFAADHFNRFIVGTVWRDRNGDGAYQAGEGVGGVTVRPDAGRFYAVTGNAGGYAVPVAGRCTYRVTFSGAAAGVRSVAVGDASVLLDFETGGR